MLTNVLLALGAYLIGSISSAVLVCRAMRLPDPRVGGSGNPGATNVLRLGSKTAAAITLVGDILKGAVPVLVANSFAAGPAVLAAVAFLAFLGHLYPVFFGFRGGKGVATALGAIVTLTWPLGFALSAVWTLVALVSRYSSLASVTAAVCAPIGAAWLHLPVAYVIGIGAMSALLILRHRANIKRLLTGTESRIGAGRTA